MGRQYKLRGRRGILLAQREKQPARLRQIFGLVKCILNCLPARDDAMAIENRGIRAPGTLRCGSGQLF